MRYEGATPIQGAALILQEAVSHRRAHGLEGRRLRRPDPSIWQPQWR
jgi:hypothetical protein